MLSRENEVKIIISRFDHALKLDWKRLSLKEAHVWHGGCGFSAHCLLLRFKGEPAGRLKWKWWDVYVASVFTLILIMISHERFLMYQWESYNVLNHLIRDWSKSIGWCAGAERDWVISFWAIGNGLDRSIFSHPLWGWSAYFITEIDQFRCIKIQPKATDFSTRL